jgi:hypothetical protein
MKPQVGYLRARKDSDRDRAAYVNYLQTWLPSFYPNPPDLAQGTHQLADSLGGGLVLRKVSSKYAWIEKLPASRPAKHTQLYYNQAKSSALRAWDKMCIQLIIAAGRSAKKKIRIARPAPVRNKVACAS